MSLTPRNIGVSKRIGRYSDAIEVAAGLRWVYTSGTPGLPPEGELPSDIEGQTRLAWKNILDVLAESGMGPADLVKVNTSLIDKAHIAPYVKVRAEILGDVRPAFMLSVIDELVKPEFLVEIEVVAAAK